MADQADYRNAFGFADAALASDKDIVDDHVIREVESRLKWSDRAQGRSLVVGIKGSGKTDLRRFIERTDQAKALVVNLNCDTGYFNLDTNQIQMRSGRIKNALALQLLGVFAEVIPTSGTRAERVKGALKEVASSAAEVGKRIGLAAEIDLKFAKLDLSKLAAAEHSGLVRDAWDDMVRKIGTALATSNKRGYILIDDVEDVFPGIEQNADFMEGLARAVVEINRSFGARLHALLFAKYGIWRFWFDHQREYDKVSSDVEMVSWTSPTLVDLIARRIALRKAIDDQLSAEQLWERAFRFEGFPDFTTRFTSICVNGPRDVIELCNRCAEAAREELITKEHLTAVVPGYSEAKLSEVGADFGDVYPDVEKLARQVLQGSKATMTAEKLASRFEERVVNDERVWDAFSQHRWFKMLGSAGFASLMYEVGIVGVDEAGRVSYAIEMPNRTVTPIDRLVVHPAFRPHLAIS